MQWKRNHQTREHGMQFKYPLGPGFALIYINYSTNITSGENLQKVWETHDPQIIVPGWGWWLPLTLLSLLKMSPFSSKVACENHFYFHPASLLSPVPFLKCKSRLTCCLWEERAIEQAIWVKEIDHLSWEWKRGERTIPGSHPDLRNSLW